MGEANVINSSSSLTLYEQLANQILDSINHEQYLPGDQLPTEMELQQSTGYSRSTVRHALRLLVNKGILVKIHGKVPSSKRVWVPKPGVHNFSV
ncbi:GntR family transcriptional regulator [Lacticaseibacillus thailandensis]|uniref:GntR family transcriptional regulator n=1 Tax=Lacticaseibacillus thailandensis TaxID=381741 RepID=UPI0006D010F9|nr:GntR family transcriptional regulator [Lacticaseibacillus thailandensis]